MKYHEATLKIGIRLSVSLLRYRNPYFGDVATDTFAQCLPHALFFQKCLLLSLILQIESNHSGGIDANGSLNGGIGLR